MMKVLNAPTTPDGCISDLKLDQWRAGELAENVAAKLREHVATCERCAARRQQLLAQAEQMLRRFPEPPRPAVPATLASRWVAASAGLAAAAALIFWIGGRRGEDAETRTKGSSHISFFVKRGDQVSPGRNGERVQPGDRLRFSLTTTRPQSVGIFGRDSTGAAFVYYPQAARSQSVGKVRDLALDTSVELDASLGSEAIFAVFCDEDFDLASLKQSLSKTAALPPLPGCTIDTLELLKVTKP
jgi:hypothetical protein